MSKPEYFQKHYQINVCIDSFWGFLTQNILTDIAVCYNSNDAAAHAVFIMIAAFSGSKTIHNTKYRKVLCRLCVIETNSNNPSHKSLLQILKCIQWVNKAIERGECMFVNVCCVVFFFCVKGCIRSV